MIVGEEGIHIKPLYLILMKNHLGNVKQCKTLIRHGKVIINGKIINDEKYRVKNEDIITVNGKLIDTSPFYYYMMNKPQGYICASKDDHDHCVMELIDCQDGFCVGRLDKNTTGFLLISNDASLQKKLLHPLYHVEKTYYVETLKPIESRVVNAFHQGIIIDQKRRCLPAKLSLIDEYHCYVTIYEGKYHQVKKMFLSCHNQVIRLHRVSFAGVTLDASLQEGEFRHLTQQEFQKMKDQYSF